MTGVRRTLLFALTGILVVFAASSASAQKSSKQAASAVVRHALEVKKAGAGSGIVTSSPAGIDCGATCFAEFDAGSSVALTATPGRRSRFAGWSDRPASLVIAADRFERSVPPGPTWGRADRGGEWTRAHGSSNLAYSVAGGRGRIAVEPGGSYGQKLATVREADVDLVARFTWNDKPRRATLNPAGLEARLIDNEHFYQGTFRLTPAAPNELRLQIRKHVGGVSAGLPDNSSVLVAANFTPGQAYWLRFQVVGRTLRVKAWRVGTAEPDTWNREATDGSLTAPGSVGIRSSSGTRSTATPLVTVDDFSATVPVRPSGCSGKGPCTVTMGATKGTVATFKRACVVPKVKGKRLRAAKRSIKKARCSVGAVKRAFSKRVKKGRVIAQRPRPGKRLALRSPVKLKVSKGRRLQR